MTPNDFFLNFPEFKDHVDRTLVAAKLNEAAVRMGGPDVTIWGAVTTPAAATPSSNPTYAQGAQSGGPTLMSLADMAQGNLAAHYLITSPFGSEFRLAEPGGKSAYLEKFEDLCLCVGGGFLVSGVLT